MIREECEVQRKWRLFKDSDYVILTLVRLVEMYEYVQKKILVANHNKENYHAIFIWYTYSS